jgi:hypothetical protein
MNLERVVDEAATGTVVVPGGLRALSIKYYMLESSSTFCHTLAVFGDSSLKRRLPLSLLLS